VLLTVLAERHREIVNLQQHIKWLRDQLNGQSES
jgi:hypothetical protein